MKNEIVLQVKFNTESLTPEDLKNIQNNIIEFIDNEAEVLYSENLSIKRRTQKIQKQK